MNPKTEKGIILSLIHKFREDAKKGITYSPIELQLVFEEALTKYNEVKKELKKELVELELVNWKGSDNIEIYHGFDKDFIIKTHIKDKYTGDVTTVAHEIPHQKVNKLLFYINQWNVGEVHKCYDFALFLGYSSWKDLWRERKFYFSDYYWPLKCLELIGLISYSGRGTITKLK